MGGVLRLAIDAALSQVDGAFGSRSDEWAVEPGDAPEFVELGEAGIAVGDAMRRGRCVQLVG